MHKTEIKKRLITRKTWSRIFPQCICQLDATCFLLYMWSLQAQTEMTSLWHHHGYFILQSHRKLAKKLAENWCVKLVNCPFNVIPRLDNFWRYRTSSQKSQTLVSNNDYQPFKSSVQPSFQHTLTINTCFVAVGTCVCVSCTDVCLQGRVPPPSPAQSPTPPSVVVLAERPAACLLGLHAFTALAPRQPFGFHRLISSKKH